MTTRHFVNRTLKLFIGVMCAVLTASCGSELLRTGRSPMFLSILALQGSQGHDPGSFANPLLSDVLFEGSVFNDLGSATFQVDAKDQTGTPALTPLNAVTMTRYRVTFRRTDGRNTPGVDVPFGFDGALTTTIPAGSSGEVIFDLVRHASKSEPPLRNLINGGGLRFISAIAEVTFFGRDQNGNELTATGSIDVVFADYGDE